MRNHDGWSAVCFVEPTKGKCPRPHEYTLIVKKIQHHTYAYSVFLSFFFEIMLHLSHIYATLGYPGEAEHSVGDDEVIEILNEIEDELRLLPKQQRERHRHLLLHHLFGTSSIEPGKKDDAILVRRRSLNPTLVKRAYHAVKRMLAQEQSDSGEQALERMSPARVRSIPRSKL
jgi:hypothetical protein